jgi:hypothetical protein
MFRKKGIENINRNSVEKKAILIFLEVLQQAGDYNRRPLFIEGISNKYAGRSNIKGKL